ncbi:TetR/AcrR family transcriptional regulator C-terminal domain-containing protein [uncultured Sphaerochaeta sp.]|uniref:TetR/AcrR family transcriptional regulator C-terminal domain-containing protein n=1 Tax=uncultured Sphaerochaeta sp. TaxID=886478 RepID=UPI002A0A9A63|nr:TetR/AcrR family transcriptional regulator C-terminal domain-containing protein [uncultured Sphaerochaeta sp.]
MSNASITKAALAQAMKECMATTPFAKISIGNICNKCGLNRKSFYYHFRDKYELINWIYETEIGHTVREELSDKHTSELALMICEYFEQNKVFYSNALEVTGPNSFRDYFERNLEPLVVQTLHVDGPSPFDSKELTAVVSDFCLSAIQRWLKSNSNMDSKQFLENLTTVSIKLAARFLELLGN